MNQRKKHQAGFTLVEILVVIVILGLLASIVGSNVIKNLTESEEDTAKINVNNFADIVRQYRISEGKLPDSFEDLITPNEKGQAYIEGYSEAPKDPWGNPYQIVVGENGNSFEVISWGPNGLEGDEDDISSKNAKDR